ncbi:2821_t:CDS:2, partial [Acaulospora morrowiae]
TLQPTCEMPIADDPTLMQESRKIDDVETKLHGNKIEIYERLDIEVINGIACQFHINNYNKDLGASKQITHSNRGNSDTSHDKGREVRECNIESRPASMKQQINCTANPISIIQPSNTPSPQ